MREIWLELSRDEYEFPIVMADTVQELARITGAKVATIRSTVSSWERGKIKAPKYVRIRYDESEVD